MNGFGPQLTDWLTSFGLSQAELARRTTLSSSAVSRIVAGRQVPNVQTCRSIAGAFGMSACRVMVAVGHLKEADLENTVHQVVPAQAQALLDLQLSTQEWRELVEYAVFLRTKSRDRAPATRTAQRNRNTPKLGTGGNSGGSRPAR